MSTFATIRPGFNPENCNLNAIQVETQPTKTRKIIEIVALVALAVLTVAVAAMTGLLLSGLTVGIIAAAATAAVITIAIIVYKIIQSKQQQKPTLPIQLATTTIHATPPPILYNLSSPVQHATPATAHNAPQVPLATVKVPSITSLKLPDLIDSCVAPDDFVKKSAEILNRSLEDIGYTLESGNYDGTLGHSLSSHFNKEIQNFVGSISSYLVNNHRALVNKAKHYPAATKNTFEDIIICSQVTISCYKVFLHQHLYEIDPSNAEFKTKLTESIEHLKYWISTENTNNVRPKSIHHSSLIVSIAVGTVKLTPFIRILLECGSDLMPQNFDNTPLMFAIADAENSVAHAILKETEHSHVSRDYLNFQRKGNGTTALHLAVGKGYKKISAQKQVLEVPNLELVRMMVKLGAKKDIQDVRGNTPLHLAAARHDYETIRLLDDPGIRSIKNNDGKTAKEMTQMGYHEAMSLLRNSVGVYLLDANEFSNFVNLTKIDAYLN